MLTETGISIAETVTANGLTCFGSVTETGSIVYGAIQNVSFVMTVQTHVLAFTNTTASFKMTEV